MLGATILGDGDPPDGATVGAGAPLVKSWRVRNDGTCAWSGGYALVFSGGDQLGGVAERVPPTAPGETDLLSVRARAPEVPGEYSGVWQLRASNGAAFGQLVVSIRVAAPPAASATLVPSATPTAASAAPTSPAVTASTPTSGSAGGGGPGGCVLQMTPLADVTIPPGSTLNPRARFIKTWRVRNDGSCEWGAGYSLLFAGGDQMGAAGEAAIPDTLPGQVVDLSLALVAPRDEGLHVGSWQLEASNGQLFGSLEVSINVLTPPSATPAPTVDPANLWQGSWESDCGTLGCGTVVLAQSGDGVSGTFGDGGTLSGSVEGDRLEGDWVQNGDSGGFALTMSSDGQSWVGTISAGGSWCGWRSGTPRPSACAP